MDDKGNFEGRQWILRDLEGKNSGLNFFDQDLAGTSRDVEGSREKIHRASKNMRVRGYFVGCRRTSGAKAENSQKYTELAGSRREKLQHRKSRC